MILTRRLPPNDELRQRVYAGEVFLLPATAASRKLAARALRILSDQAETSGQKDRPAIVREAMEANTLTPHEMAALREMHGTIKVKISTDQEGENQLKHLLGELGFRTEDTIYDALRLRLVLSGDAGRPENARSHSVHRDTWYANSQSQINFWLSLRDVVEEETFGFFADYFDRPIANSSAGFDYQRWMSTTGWQNTTISGEYPRVTDLDFKPTQASKQTFAAYAGEILIFSAAHLHQTNPLDNGKARFSLDFRALSTGDHHEKIGAPNYDNASTGSAIQDYKEL
jgi:hypothetical protein